MLLAVSGGRDSMAMLSLALALHDRRTPSAFVPIVGHVDHALRAESGDEAAVLGELAERLAVPFACRRLDWPPDGTRVSSETARHARWQALDDLAEAAGADTILTAHHADDQAETMLMRLARGTGLDGLVGIPERRETTSGRVVLRPLLGCDGAALAAIVDDADLPFIDDPTNADATRPRERLRHEVLPTLEAIHPGAARHLAALAREAATLAEAEPSRAPSQAATLDRSACRSIGCDALTGRLRATARHLGGDSVSSLPRELWRQAASIIVDRDPRPRRLPLGPTLELIVHRNAANIRSTIMDEPVLRPTSPAPPSSSPECP